MKKYECYIAFVEHHDNGTRSLIDSIIIFVSGKFMHVEIVFVSDMNNIQTSGICRGETIFFANKKFAMNHWRFYKLDIDNEKVEHVMDYCKQQSQDGIAFDENAMIRAVTPFPKIFDDSKTFCVMYTIKVLQTIGLLQDVCPSGYTPTDLYKMLKKHLLSTFKPIIGKTVLI